MTIETLDGHAPRRQHPIVLVLDNLRSAYNVGNIYRLAEVAGLARIVTCGYTATPPHPKLMKTARGCDELVTTTHAESAHAAVAALRDEGFAVIAVETVVGAPDLWAAPPTFPCAFVFGNEALGITSDALAACDSVVRLPVFGSKNSLNVANCAAAVVYNAIRVFEADGSREGDTT
jgi:tRNA G18 (ribose-2'-O)-methylase SpoU